MKNLTAMALGSVPLLATGVSFAQGGEHDERGHVERWVDERIRRDVDAYPVPCCASRPCGVDCQAKGQVMAAAKYARH